MSHDSIDARQSQADLPYASPANADTVGEQIDQLITLEIKNRGLPHNLVRSMYAAARRHSGGRPLSMVAAERLRATLGRGDTVLMLTGAGYPPTMPTGENDGPPGLISLANALYRGLGAVPVFVCEAIHSGPIVATSEAAGLMIRDFEVARDYRLGAAISRAPDGADAVEPWIDELFARTTPRALVTAERLGPAPDGKLYSATAHCFTDAAAKAGYEIVDIAPVVERASRQGLPTIGVGDHGNELGFGAIRDAVVACVPNGERMATTVATDLILPCMMSNWGCYGIQAALAFLLQRPDLMHTPEQEERIVRACLDAGGLEGMNCTTAFTVDGLDGRTSMACIQILRDIVSKGLEAPVTRLV
jgi:hypothetical protein